MVSRAAQTRRPPLSTVTATAVVETLAEDDAIAMEMRWGRVQAAPRFPWALLAATASRAQALIAIVRGLADAAFGGVTRKSPCSNANR